MRCPQCHTLDDRVVDSREAADGSTVRRRRECLACGRRFTTYERVDIVMPVVVKKDGRREPWDRDKVLAGIKKACEKRPVPADAIEAAVARIETAVQEDASGEVDGAVVGEAVMECLKGLDEVAYVRFASVYRSFRDISEFKAALDGLMRERGDAKSSK